MNNVYLVRPEDNAIFEIDPFNGCYRPYITNKIKNRSNAYSHFTFKNLTEDYGWFPIEKSEIPKYQELNKEWHRIWAKYYESDGHDGIKGRNNLTPEEIEFINLERD